MPLDEQIEAPERTRPDLVDEDMFDVENHGYVAPEPQIVTPYAIEVPAEIQARIEADRDSQSPSTLTPK